MRKSLSMLKYGDGGDSLHVYPGFIDGNAYWGSPDQKEFEETPSRGEPSYERAGIRPERKARDAVQMSSDDFKTAMQAGFTTAALGTKGYMIPGQLDLFFLQPELQINNLYAGGIGMQVQFEESYRVYPSTVMGVMAQLEQLMADAEALKQQQDYYGSKPNEVSPPGTSPTLEALYPVMQNDQRVFFKVDSKEMIERVFQLQDQLGFDLVIVSGMEAYKVADQLNERDVPVLASINFPEKPKWKKDESDEDEEDDKKEDKKKKKDKKKEEKVTEEMQQFRDKRWAAYEKRYENIKSLMEVGVEVGFASADLELKELGKRLKDWKEYGDVTDSEMMRIMTINTANILGRGNTLGEIKTGNVASFSVMSKPFMDKEAKVLYSISEGMLNEFND